MRQLQANHLHSRSSGNHTDFLKLVVWAVLNTQKGHLADKTGSPLQGNFGIGPLIASLSPGCNPWMYVEASPFSYLLIRKVSSPGVSDREMGVYALITGFPFASVSPSGLEDLTMTQEATGSKEASSSFNLKTNLAM